MSFRGNALCLAALAWIPCTAVAQSIAEFEKLPSPSASDLTARLTGKTFTTTGTNGTLWRIEYKSNGYVIINVQQRGFSNNISKPWRVEDGKICSTDRGVEECKPTRLDGSTIVVQVTPTETVRYSEQ
ncbi:hypothetical protein [Variovorax sp. PvP013]|jgi:hypothetical protein|uniref:hypothetical protein n=1 Tax=Variovorax sp. PvP013 TaxID=3156435 RepID=UPI003D1AAACA